MKRLLLLSVALLTAIALTVPMAAQATSINPSQNGRLFYATDTEGNLFSFSANNPRQLDSARPLTGLPVGVTLKGIDFRPATGELYGVGSDSVVYRVSPVTGKVVAEGPAFGPRPLEGGFFGVDFDPTVDRIRLTSQTPTRTCGLIRTPAPRLAWTPTSTPTTRLWSARPTPTRRSAPHPRRRQPCTR